MDLVRFANVKDAMRHAETRSAETGGPFLVIESPDRDHQDAGRYCVEPGNDPGLIRDWEAMIGVYDPAEEWDLTKHGRLALKKASAPVVTA